MAIYALDSTDRIEVHEKDLDVIEPDADVSYTIRPLTMADIRTYRKQATRKIADRRSHSMVDEFDADEFSDLMLDHALVAWSGVLFKSSGEPVPCTLDYKVKALDLSRRKAILDVAGANQSTAKEDARRDSFRGAP